MKRSKVRVQRPPTPRRTKPERRTTAKPQPALPAETILREFVDDVRAVGAERVGEEWPDLLQTFEKAVNALDRHPLAFYLMVVVGDVEPELFGPFVTEEQRDAAAKSHRVQDPERHDGIYWLNVGAKGALETGAYSGGFFDDATFSTTCPKCGSDGKLIVIEVTLASSGKRIKNMCSKLHADGFEVGTDVEDASTDEEIVECGACKAKFSLSEVTL